MDRSHKINITVCVILMIVVAALAHFAAPHAITFQHENSYYIYSLVFAAQTICSIGGVATYLANIACSNTLLCTITTCFAATYMFYVLTIASKKISHNNDPFFGAIVPMVIMLSNYMNLDFMLEICSVLTITTLVHLLISFNNVKLKLIATPIIILITYFTTPYSTEVALIMVYSAAYLLFSFIVVKRLSKFKKAIFLALPITLIISSTILYKGYNPRLKYVIQMEQLLNQDQWEKVLEQSGKGVVRSRQTCYYTNIALLKTNNFSNYLFHYPQISGAESLHLPDYHMRLSDLIYDIAGIPSEALHCAFENYVSYGKNHYNIPKLIYYYDKMGKTQIADRFAAYLPSHKRILPEGYVSYGADSSLVGETIINTFEYICKADTTNRIAYECMMAHYALSGRIVKFIDNIDRAMQFFGSTLPPYYEDIILLYQSIFPKNEQRTIVYNVSASRTELFNEFKNITRKRGAPPLKFRSTYWFYNKYINPKGEKLYTN